MKICQMGTELLRAGGQTDRHEEAICRFSQFCERSQNKTKPSYNSQLYLSDLTSLRMTLYHGNYTVRKGGWVTFAKGIDQDHPFVLA
jgi:hypothetical protein